MDKTKKTICWDCALSGYGNVSECPWEREFKPIDGWTAERSDIFIVNGNLQYYSESYVVAKCPLYKQMLPRAREKEKANREQAKTHKSWQRIGRENVERMGVALKRCRICHGLTQAKLARMLGRSQGSVASYETGICTYDIESVKSVLPDILDFLEEEYEN